MNGVDGRQLARTPSTDQTDRRVSPRGPDDRHEVACDRRHVGIHHAQHCVGGNGGVDGVAAVTKDLRTDFTCEVVWGRDNPFRSPHELRCYAVSWREPPFEVTWV